MRVAIFAHGRGRGHATRCADLLTHLQDRGIEATLLAGGTAYETLRHMQGVRETDVLLPGASALLRLPQYVRRATRQLDELKATIVVSDGSAPGVLAARTLQMPVIAMGHDVVFQFEALSNSPALLLKQRINAWHLRYANAWTGAHFLPDPSVPKAHDHARRPVAIGRPALRGLVPRDAEDRGHVVVYLRDEATIGALRPWARSKLPQIFFGPERLTPAWMKPGGTDRMRFLEALHGARAVVGSAGSNLIAESIALKKPMLLLHHPGEAEQTLNAQWVERAGLGARSSFEQCSFRTVESFERRLEKSDWAHFDLLGQLTPIATLVDGQLSTLAR